MAQVTEAQAEAAIAILKRAIDAAENSNQAGENAVVMFAAAPALFNGCNAMLGLVQLILGRDDLTDELREVLTSNHRIAEATAAVIKAGDEA